MYVEILIIKSMKQISLWVIAASLSICALAFTACTNGGSTSVSASDEITEATADVATDTTPDTYLAAIDRYMVNDIAVNYAQAEYHIPVGIIVAVDESNPDSVLVWGDFWIENYNISADTLLFVSGGSHPGLMHVAKTGNAYTVTAFDVVEDGSHFLPSAKRIFGDKFDAFQKIQSNDELRKELRRMAVSAYVKQNGIKAVMYKDYGWDPVQLEQ